MTTNQMFPTERQKLEAVRLHDVISHTKGADCVMVHLAACALAEIIRGSDEYSYANNRCEAIRYLRQQIRANRYSR